MRLVITDFKWSYGIESLTRVFGDYFTEHQHEVVILGSQECTLGNCVRVTSSRSFVQILMDCLNPSPVWQMIRFFRSFSADAVYLNSSHPLNAVLVALLRLLFPNVFIVSHIHDPKPHKMWAISAAIVGYQKLQLRHSHHIVCYGQAIKEFVSRHYGVAPESITVLEHGPNFPPEPCSTRIQPRFFSLIGRIVDYKGIPYFLDASRRLNEKAGSGDVEFLLAGQGDLGPYRTDIAKLPNLKVIDRFLSNAEVNHYIAQSYALVMPYIGGVLQSGMVATAYANKCPVIVTTTGCLQEQVIDGETGFIVPPRDVDGLCDAMEVLLDPGLREKMEANCLGYYHRRLQWADVLQRWETELIALVKSFRERGWQST